MDERSVDDVAVDDAMIAGAYHTGAMIALVPSVDSALRLAVPGGEPVSELHLTLGYYGDAALIPDEVKWRIKCVVKAEITNAPTVVGDLFSIAAFNPQPISDFDLVAGGGEPCVVGLLSGSQLEYVHNVICGVVKTVFVEAGIDCPPQHTPWYPHVTLAYTPALDLTTLADRVGPVTFDAIRIAFGDVVHDIPLGDAQREYLASQYADDDDYVDDMSSFTSAATQHARRETAAISASLTFGDSSTNVDIVHALADTSLTPEQRETFVALTAALTDAPDAFDETDVNAGLGLRAAVLANLKQAYGDRYTPLTTDVVHPSMSTTHRGVTGLRVDITDGFGSDVYEFAFNPKQPRDTKGRWTKIGVGDVSVPGVSIDTGSKTATMPSASSKPKSANNIIPHADIVAKAQADAYKDGEIIGYTETPSFVSAENTPARLVSRGGTMVEQETYADGQWWGVGEVPVTSSSIARDTYTDKPWAEAGGPADIAAADEQVTPVRPNVKAGRDALHATPLVAGNADLETALGVYRGEGYKDINAAYRNPDQDVSAKVRGEMTLLNDGFKNHALASDAQLYRGVGSLANMFGSDIASGNLTGVEWISRAPTSTTAKPSVTGEFANEYIGDSAILTIIAPKGTPAMRVSGWDGEAEALLGPELKYRVVSDDGIVDNIRRLTVEVVGAQ